MCVYVWNPWNKCKYFNLHWPLVEVDWSCTCFTDRPLHEKSWLSLEVSVLWFLSAAWVFLTPSIFFCISDSVLYYFVILFPLLQSVGLSFFPHNLLSHSLSSLPVGFLAIQHLLAGSVKFKVQSLCINNTLFMSNPAYRAVFVLLCGHAELKIGNFLCYYHYISKQLRCHSL